MGYEYSPMNPYVWATVGGVWGLTWIIVQFYRKKNQFDEGDDGHE